jgi:phospholipid/cholesterol/gamma-HCH transport system permease protein
MSAAAFNIRNSSTGRVLELSGDWSSLNLGDEALDLGRELEGAEGETQLDLSAVGRLDTAGTYVVLKAVRRTLSALPTGEAGKLFALVQEAVDEKVPSVSGRSLILQFFANIGQGLARTGEAALNSANFAGRLYVELVRAELSPEKLRKIALVHIMETAGVDALPIVIVMNFFIGAVVALVGTNLLASLGVAVFTVQLVGVAVFREFAVLITGILLAGRSASSFAAQIGSMKMNQEIDAMQVIGVDPFRALVIPRVLALLIMMPILTFAGMAAGIIGGFLVSWAALGLGPMFFFARLQETVSINHFWVGMSKVPVLAMLIAMAGCQHGLAVEGDVESLGAEVTSAVVQSIFLIILVDALFAIIYMELHI